jgi:hypothetical protein
MSVGPQTKAALDGLYKDVYADKMDSLLPDFTYLMKRVPFAKANKTGRDFVKAVKLTNEQGFTYGAGIQTLAGIISADVDDAKVRGSSLTLQTGFSYDAAANMASSKAAFVDATKFKFMAMMEAASYRLELQMLYGGQDLGTVASVSTDTVTLSDATWASGIWAGQEGAEIDIYETTGVTLQVSSKIVSVDSDTKSITISTGDGASVAATDIIRFKGATGNEMTGLRSVVSNSGTLYGVSGSTYSLWQGNSFGVGSANLTLRKIYQGTAKAVGKGLMEDLSVLVSPATYATLANDQASLRRYNAATSEAENGFETIKFYGPNGRIEVVTHPLIKEGEAIAFPHKRAERIGSTDLTFNTPGKGDEMFQQLSSQTGYECRLYSEQSIFLPCPAKGILFTGISNA